MSDDYKRQNEILRDIIRETLWMARRYANGRKTYAPRLVNKNIMLSRELNIDLDGPIEFEYAKDGTFGEWDSETKKFKGELC